ncbi:MAG TPA: T9SS type A sorting domain-containing protein [Candidatus Kapabacteria bacterium]|nr:T9SS type A sorting domain-containing protein [Candidatus Kapabacteria bacterium]
MKIQTFRIASFIVIALALSMPAAKAQQRTVLFETFTNSYEPHGGGDAERTTFNANVASVVSSEGSKIIHLDHHIGNESDALQNAYSFNTANHVMPGSAVGNTYTPFWGAVDRTVYSSTGTRQSFSEGDWTSAINSEYQQSPAATMQLVSATLDKNNSQTYVLHVKVNVTLAQSIPDSLIIRYAIVQDGCLDNQNGGTLNVTLNDVVRYITYTNSSTSGNSFVVVAGGASAGTQKVMSWDQSLYGPKSINASIPYDYTKIRLVAFLESTSGGDFQVVNAAVLRQDLDTLQPPPPTLSFNENYISGDTLQPGSTADIFFNSTNLPNGVTAYYSLDNGTTWRFMEDTQFSPFFWNVPDSLTTQGKIKLVAVGDPSLVSIEAGTFVIAPADSVAFVRPTPGEMLGADTNYMIEWTKYGFDSVILQYSLADDHGGFPNWDTLADGITSTFYKWKIPDTNRAAQLQLIPVRNEAPAASVQFTILKFVNSVANSKSESGLAITDIFPNPAASGEEMVLGYTDVPGRHVSVQVLDLLGRVVGNFAGENNQKMYLDTRALASGTYIVRVSDGANVVSRSMEITR